jgi:co-chaperonin GroES (HSP10)
MNSIHQFIVKPIGERYNNELTIGNKKLIVNSSISDHKFVNREAEIIAVPLAYETNLSKGDRVIVHHNLFRRYYNLKGESVNSTKFFKDDMCFASIDQVYMKKSKSSWETLDNYCFIKPVVDKDASNLSKLKKCIGIVKYSNSTLEALKISNGDLVGFKKNREFEFLIDGEVLYCMQSNDILIKYENKGNETEYNPSWANSS